MPPLGRRPLLLLACALLLTAAATAHKLGNELVWDDLYVIEQGEVIHDWAHLPDVMANRTMYASVAPDATAGAATGVDTWRPVTLATFMWDSTISGRDPIAYHVTNLLLHLGCVTLLFFLARRLLPERHRPLAPFAAAWFGVTPLLGEAHVWIDGRSDPLCALFGLAALLLWCRAQDEGVSGVLRWVGFVGSALLFLAGLLSKEVLLLALPAVVLFPFDHPTPLRERLRRASGFIVTGLLYLGLRAQVLSGLRTHQNPDQLMAALLRLPALLLDGLLELLVPTRVHVRLLLEDYNALGPAVLGALFLPVLALAILLIAYRRRAPLLSWGALLYACTLAPAAIIATLLWPGFGRYLYLPAVGVAVALASGAGWLLDRPALRDRRWLLGALGGVYLIALGVRLHFWVYDWHDEETLWTRTAEECPDRSHGHGFLGMTLLEQDRPGEAVPELLKADQLAPDRPRYLKQLGWAFYAMGETNASLNIAATGIERYDGAPAFQLLAAHNLRAARPDLAVHHLLECLRRSPADPGCRQLVRELCADPAWGAICRATLEQSLEEASDAELEAAVRPLLGG